MIIKQSFLIFTFILLPQVVQANNDAANSDITQGEQLYKTYCSACHGITGGMNMSQRVAPPVIAIKMHYIGPYPDRASFVSAVANWVEKQDVSKTLMPGAIRRFNIMPPVSVSREDAEKIAAYIYQGDLEKPAGFDKHFEEMHGKNRGNQGM